MKCDFIGNRKLWDGVIKAVCLEKTEKSDKCGQESDSSLSPEQWVLINAPQLLEAECLSGRAGLERGVRSDRLGF